jgi:hypothetical protein
MIRSFPSNSCTRDDPIAHLLADKYNLNDFLSWGGTRIGGDFRYCLMLLQSYWCSSPHINFWSASSFNKGVNGWVLSDRLDKSTDKINLANQRSKLLLVALTDFWPTSIPLSCIKIPRNCPAETPKAHLLGFICFLCSFFNLTTTSSM